MAAFCVLRQHVLLTLASSVSEELAKSIVEPQDVLRWILQEELGAHGLSPVEGQKEEPQPTAVVALDVTGEYQGAAAEVMRTLIYPTQRGPRPSKKRRREAPPEDSTSISPAAVLQALQALSVEELPLALASETLSECLSPIPAPAARLTMSLRRESLYLHALYVKLSRRLPQSPWIIGGERKGDGSVEEEIGKPVADLFGASEVRFHAEGREDIDVRMLGQGRPFVVEVKDARAVSLNLEDVQVAINRRASGLLEIRQLRFCKASDMAALQRDAESHRKTYLAVCWCSQALTTAAAAAVATSEAFEVNQKTPLRVLHRRALATRPKTVFSLGLEVLNPHYFKLRVCAQAGMYIKEFVHGDLGRTIPSMRSLLGGQVEILQLDVEGVEEA